MTKSSYPQPARTHLVEHHGSASFRVLGSLSPLGTKGLQADSHRPLPLEGPRLGAPCALVSFPCLMPTGAL